MSLRSRPITLLLFPQLVINDIKQRQNDADQDHGDHGVPPLDAPVRAVTAQASRQPASYLHVIRKLLDFVVCVLNHFLHVAVHLHEKVCHLPDLWVGSRSLRRIHRERRLLSGVGPVGLSLSEEAVLLNRYFD